MWMPPPWCGTSWWATLAAVASTTTATSRPRQRGWAARVTEPFRMPAASWRMWPIWCHATRTVQPIPAIATVSTRRWGKNNSKGYDMQTKIWFTYRAATRSSQSGWFDNANWSSWPLRWALCTWSSSFWPLPCARPLPNTTTCACKSPMTRTADVVTVFRVSKVDVGTSQNSRTVKSDDPS